MCILGGSGEWEACDCRKACQECPPVCSYAVRPRETEYAWFFQYTVLLGFFYGRAPSAPEMARPLQWWPAFVSLRKALSFPGPALLCEILTAFALLVCAFAQGLKFCRRGAGYSSGASFAGLLLQRRGWGRCSEVARPRAPSHGSGDVLIACTITFIEKVRLGFPHTLPKTTVTLFWPRQPDLLGTQEESLQAGRLNLSTLSFALICCAMWPGVLASHLFQVLLSSHSQTINRLKTMTTGVWLYCRNTSQHSHLAASPWLGVSLRTLQFTGGAAGESRAFPSTEEGSGCGNERGRV
jgi:hypothetical protein